MPQISWVSCWGRLITITQGGTVTPGAGDRRFKAGKLEFVLIAQALFMLCLAKASFSPEDLLVNLKALQKQLTAIYVCWSQKVATVVMYVNVTPQWDINST